MAGGLRLAALISNQTLRCAAPTSPHSVDGSGHKASILRRPGPLLFLFQATALRLRPFCTESPKTAARKRERTGQRRLREDEWKKWEDQSATSPCAPTTLQPPDLLLLFILGWFLWSFPPPTCCTAAPRPSLYQENPRLGQPSQLF